MSHHPVRLPSEQESDGDEIEGWGCCMHGDCARHCPDDMCHGNVCEICPEDEDDEDYDDTE